MLMSDSQNVYDLCIFNKQVNLSLTGTFMETLIFWLSVHINMEGKSFNILLYYLQSIELFVDW